MAYLAYPMAKSKPPYGDIYHDSVPVIVTSVGEFGEIMGERRADFGCESCPDATPVAITLGPSRCGIWLEAEVLLDAREVGADELIRTFELGESWLWDWSQDYHGDRPADEAVMQPPHQVRV